MANKVAIIEAKPSRNDYVRLFEHSFEFDRFSLTSDDTLKKVLKKDVDIDVDIDKYDWVVLVGSEPLKYYTKINSITEYSGKLVDDKFLPVINPAMLAFKPDAKRLWEQSRDTITNYVLGKIEKFNVDTDRFKGIQDTQEAVKYLKYVLNSPSDFVAVDTETSGLYPRNAYILGISISCAPDEGAYISTDCVDEEVEDLFQKIFDLKNIIFHNAKFDIAMLEYHFGFKFPQFEDTMMVHYMLDELPGTHGLKQLALKYTKYGDYEKPMYDWMDQFRKENRILKGDFKWEWIPFDVLKDYAAMDAAVTYLLYPFFMKYLNSNKKLVQVYRDILLPGVRFLIDVQDNGVPFDRDRLMWAQTLMTTEIHEAMNTLSNNEAVKRFEKAQGKEFNPNSPTQLRKLLFDFIGLEPTGKKTGTGQNSTDAEVLQELSKESEIPALILNVRQKSKIKNTYLDKIIPQLDLDDRLRTNFNLHTTTSGRLSSSGKLNMQQTPRDNPIIKGCIKAIYGRKIVAIDLTTAEMYVAAALSGDKNLQDVFKQGTDFHSTIAQRVFHLDCEVEQVKEFYPMQRQAAKAISFGILYGAGPHKIRAEIAKDGGRMSLNEASGTIDDYFRAFPKLKKWIDSNIEFIKQNAFAYSAFGRKRRLGNVKSKDEGIAGHEVRSGLNFLVQSVASDINLLGAIELNNEIKSLEIDAKIFALVHDSILADVAEEHVEIYTERAVYCLQRDRGVYISGCPIGCDVDVADDYSLGKFEKTYMNAA